MAKSTVKTTQIIHCIFSDSHRPELERGFHMRISISENGFPVCKIIEALRFKLLSNYIRDLLCLQLC